MRTLRAGTAYFALVFGAGLLLGPIRILWIVPAVGVRWAELLEAPVMLAVIVVAARWIVRRFALSRAPALRLAVGVVALGLLLIAEFTVVLALRGITIGEYLAGRDPVADAVYRALLGAFAAMPVFVARKSYV
jgi:hypothetical protein